MEINAERLDGEFKLLLTTAKTHFHENTERFARIKQMIADYSDSIMVAPASSKTQFHGAFPGGWLIHTNNVIRNGISIAKLWQSNGAVIDFTDDELVFAAMFHDIGKLGDKDSPMYIDQESNWHFQRGDVYQINPQLPYMPSSERSIFILQKYGISMSYNEFTGIRLSDGLFVDSNSPYLHVSQSNPSGMTSHLPYIIHFANWMSARIEGQKL